MDWKSALTFLVIGLLKFNFSWATNPVSDNFYIDNTLPGKEMIHQQALKGMDKGVFHLFSHGRPGELLIQGKWYSGEELARTIAAMLPRNTRHLNIYGCHFAQGKGQEQLNFLGAHLGISIGASTNITGLNGDWTLEAGTSIQPMEIRDYAFNLQACAGTVGGIGDNDDFDGDGVCNVDDDDDDNDGIPDSAEYAPCNTTFSPTSRRTNNNVRTGTETWTRTTGFWPFQQTQTCTSGIGGTNHHPLGIYSECDISGTYSASWNATVRAGIPLTVRYTLRSVNDHWLPNGNSSASFRINGITVHSMTNDFNGGERTFTFTPGSTNVNLDLSLTFTRTNFDCGAQNLPEIDLFFRFDQQGEVSYNNCPMPDTDNDGIADKFDLDSDGDGCPDALEGDGGITQAAITDFGMIAGNVDANGVPNGGTVQGAGSALDASAQSPECDACDAASSSFVDTDSDGVADECDLDDDNDGILDVNELQDHLRSFQQGDATPSYIVYRFPGMDVNFVREPALTDWFLDTATDLSVNGGISATTPAGQLELRNIDDTGFLEAKGNGNYIEQTFGTGDNLVEPYLDRVHIEWETSDEADNYALTTEVYEGTDLIYQSPAKQISPTTSDDSSSATRLFYFLIPYEHRVALKSGTTYTLRIYPHGYDAASSTEDFGAFDDLTLRFSGALGLDTDNDGTLDYHDLDSDSDGCPDALEGESSTFVYGDLNPDGSIDTTAFPIDGDGVPGSTDNAIGTSRNNGQQAAECDSCDASSTLFSDNDRDGIGDDCDADDDNDGILDDNEICHEASSIDWNAHAGLSATPGNDTSTDFTVGSNTSTNNVTVELKADLYHTSIDADNSGAFNDRDPLGGEGSGIVFFPNGITETSQQNRVVVTFEKPVYNLTFAITDVDGGNGVSNERLRINGSLDGNPIILTPAEITENTGPLPAQNGNVFTSIPGTTSFENVFTVAYTRPVDRLEFIFSIDSDNVNNGNALKIFDFYFDLGIDRDHDGLVDCIDPDSDNDGCPDALEAEGSDFTFDDLARDGSIDTTIHAVDTDVNSATHGSPGGTNNTIGTAHDDSQQAAECDSCDATSTLFLDTDNDGIGNDCDLDDDNDGILDQNECGLVGLVDESDDTMTYLGWVEGTEDHVTVDNVALGELAPATNSVIDKNSRDGGRMLRFVDRNNGTSEYITKRFEIGQFNRVRLTFEYASLIHATYGQGPIGFEITVVDGVNTTRFNTPILPLATDGLFISEWQDYELPPYTLVNGDFVDISIRALAQSDTEYSSILIDGIKVYADCGDSDNDGIGNHLDLDSDNDGCPDVLEAASSTFTHADLNPDGSINTTVHPVDTDENSATHGSPGGTDNGIGSLQDSSQQSVECDSCNLASSLFVDTDNDGIGNDCDLDDDNDGIWDTEECEAINIENYGTFGWDATGTARDLQNPPGGNYAFVDNNSSAGEYAIISRNTANWHSSGYWDDLAGADTGHDNDAYLAVNGAITSEVVLSEDINLPQGVAQTIQVQVANAAPTAGVHPIEIGMRLRDTSGTIVAFTSTGSIADSHVWHAVSLSIITIGTDYTLEIYNISLGSSGNDFAIDALQFSHGMQCQDLDGDGLVESLDLDSDGDSCPDALESRDSPYGIPDLNMDGSVNTVLHPVDTASNGVTFGVPDGVSFGMGTSQDDTTYAETCNYIEVTIAGDNDISVIEGEDAVLTIELSEGFPEDITLEITFTNISASDEDYTVTTTVTIPANSTSVDLVIPILDDTIIEPTESFQISISSTHLALDIVEGDATVNIIDNDAAIQPNEHYEEDVEIICGDMLPPVPQLTFSGGCHEYEVDFEEQRSDIDESHDYWVIRTWTVTDICGTVEIFEQRIYVAQPDPITVETESCIYDAPVDLLSHLPEGIPDSGTFELLDGDGTLDGSFYDSQNAQTGLHQVYYEVLHENCVTSVIFAIDVNGDCRDDACNFDRMIMPKTITVNGDGINDYFEIKGMEACGYTFQLKVFNRWGTVIYQSDDYDNSWDGTAPENSMGTATHIPAGTYYYIITVPELDYEGRTGYIYIGGL